MTSKLELLQHEHEKIEFETENVEAANSNLKQELEEKNRESVQMKTENVKLMQSIANHRSKGDMAKETVQNLSSVIRKKDLEIDGLNKSLVILVHESSKQHEPEAGNELYFLQIMNFWIFEFAKFTFFFEN